MLFSVYTSLSSRILISIIFYLYSAINLFIYTFILYLNIDALFGEWMLQHILIIMMTITLIGASLFHSSMMNNFWINIIEGLAIVLYCFISLITITFTLFTARPNNHTVLISSNISAQNYAFGICL